MRRVQRIAFKLINFANNVAHNIPGGPQRPTDDRGFRYVLGEMDTVEIGGDFSANTPFYQAISASTHGETASNLLDRAAWVLLYLGAVLVRRLWPHASRNLIHYLRNIGTPLQLDVAQLLDDVPEFRSRVENLQSEICFAAARRYANLGLEGPAALGFDSAWAGFTCGEYKHLGWFFALGDWEYRLAGRVMISAASEEAPPSTLVSTRLYIRDRYDWDCGPVTMVGRFSIRHGIVARLHNRGIAQEFVMYGEARICATQPSDTRNRSLPTLEPSYGVDGLKALASPSAPDTELRSASTPADEARVLRLGRDHRHRRTSPNRSALSQILEDRLER